MEDGDNSHTEVLSNLNSKDISGRTPDMANYPDLEVSVIKNKSASETSSKVNGESENRDDVDNDQEEDESTDEEALVIDEESKNQKKANAISNRKRLLSPSSRSDFKGFKKRMLRKSTEVLKIVNDCINAAQLEENENLTSEENCDNVADTNKQGEFDSIVLQEAITKTIKDDTEIPKQEDIDNDNESPKTNDHLTQKPIDVITEENTPHSPLEPKPTNVTVHKLKPTGNKSNKKTPSPKLTEYAQYLGLQPTVKFKCYKCSESSFPSMSALNEHQQQCLVQPPTAKPSPAAQAALAPTAPSTNFRVTRKVYLCSACGTYYENWNLFLHMREVHRRFICLYCLGMFSLVEKLSQHLVSKHNCVPSHYLSAEEYLSTCKEACFIMCCHCERVFTEQDNFFDHVCSERTTTCSDKACWSCGAKGTTPHLPSCKASLEQPSSSSQKANKILNQKMTNSKSGKTTKKTPFANVEHVTADSPSKPISPNRPEPEQTCDIANLCTVDMEPTTIKSEPMSPDKPAQEPSPSATEESSQEKHAESETATEETSDADDTKNAVDDTENKEVQEENPVLENDKPMENKIDIPIKEIKEGKVNEEHNDNQELNDNHELNDNNNLNNNDELNDNQQLNDNPEINDHQEKYNEIAENDSENDEEPEEEEEEKKMEVTNESLDENNASQVTDSQPSETEEEQMDNDKDESQSDQCNESEKETESDGNMETDVNIKTNELDEPVKETESEHGVDLQVSQDTRNRNSSMSETEMEIDNASSEPPEELRRVPKVTLKLPPPGTTYSDNDTDDSEKLTMEVEENEESEQEYDESQENTSKEMNDEKPVNGFEEHDKEVVKSPTPDHTETEPFPVAGDDIAIVELELEQPLDKFTTENLLRKCLGATIPTCIYCNHARKISVNGKQLGLHAIAEHRFSATVNSITAEELIPHNFVARIKDGLEELENKYFNLDGKLPEENEEQLNDINFKREYECFQCRYVTTIHKELYLHNRKMHAKTILLCIICKSNFYSYSELICHLCPGNYDLNNEMKFRCCMCDIDDLPSAFRLMVHLRKKHHTCDVCLEGCINQSRLSNHVWKHKLHHLCYRCGIAYRNKPDITKHLFWKHGTESVLCKKCLQKKWPHVYHFCIPPTSFVCEECNLSFSRAVYLKVHKRLHSNEKKHLCSEENCTESFISKKLLLKHEKRHREPEPIPEKPMELINGDLTSENDSNKPESLEKDTTECKENGLEKVQEDENKKKNIIDVYDLPALNLSESDSDDSEDEKPKPASTEPAEGDPKQEETPPDTLSIKPPAIEPISEPVEDEQKPVQIVDGIWDNFKQYQATIEKRDSFNMEVKEPGEDLKEDVNKIESVHGVEKTENSQSTETLEKTEILKEDIDILEEIKPDINVIMVDHDYCLNSTQVKQVDKENDADKKDESSEMDHDYCTNKQDGAINENKLDDLDKKKNKTIKKKNSSSSDSSSDSDSSSCTCGSNCSCSSSSGSSSSSSSSSDSDSSSSEGRRRIAARRERRKERAKRKKESETSQAASNTSAVDVVVTEDNPPPPPIIELPIEESDLETDETETDEDFYDEHPQRIANKLLEEKRNQLMLLAGVAPPVTNGSIVECSRPSTPSIPEDVAPKKKVKSKKRKKKSRSSTPKQDLHHHIPFHNNQSPLAIQSPLPSNPLVHSAIPSPIHRAVTTPPVVPRHLMEPVKTPHTTGSGSETDSNVRSSKRRRVPNKFYGYSSDEDAADKPPAPPILKWRKSDLPSTPHVTAVPKYVPPITIKNIPSPAPVVEPIQAPVVHHTEVADSDSDADDVQQHKSSSDSSDSNRNDDSDSDGGQLHISQPQFSAMPQVQRTNENLYCYCQCPYDEVSEMIACDGRECAIEWFHFECVGIMVPPKGKWFCPDCRKKSTLRNDFIQT